MKISYTGPVVGSTTYTVVEQSAKPNREGRVLCYSE